MSSISNLSIRNNIPRQEDYKELSSRKRVASSVSNKSIKKQRCKKNINKTKETNNKLLKLIKDDELFNQTSSEMDIYGTNCIKRINKSKKVKHVWKSNQVDLLLNLASERKKNEKKYTWRTVADNMNRILEVDFFDRGICKNKHRQLITKMKSRISLIPQQQQTPKIPPQSAEAQGLPSSEKTSLIPFSTTLEIIQTQPKTRKHIKWTQDKIELLVRLRDQTNLTFSEIGMLHFKTTEGSCQCAYQRYQRAKAKKKEIEESKQSSVPNAQIQQDSASLEFTQQPIATLQAPISQPSALMSSPINEEENDYFQALVTNRIRRNGSYRALTDKEWGEIAAAMNNVFYTSESSKLKWELMKSTHQLNNFNYQQPQQLEEKSALIRSNSESSFPEQQLDTSFASLIEQMVIPREYRNVTGTQTDDFDISTFFNPKSHLIA